MYIGHTHWWEPPPLAVGTLSKKISATMTPEVFGGFHVRRLKSSKNTNHVIICNIFSVYKCNTRSDSSILIPFHHPFDMPSPLRFPPGCTDTSYPLWPMPFPPTKKNKQHLLPFFRRWKSKIFRCWIFLPRLSANSWSMKPDPSEVSKCAVGLPFAMPSRRGTGINIEFGHVETKKQMAGNLLSSKQKSW